MFGSSNLGVLFVLGVGLFGGTLGAGLFRRLRIPAVVGYIVIGMLIGRTGLEIVTGEDIRKLELLNVLALGIIGLVVGGELRVEDFRERGRQFLSILLWEGMGAFFLVAVSSGVVVLLVSGSIATAIAAGLVFGAIASATDPASTSMVLREYRARGVLTTTLIAIVVLDDGLAVSLYALGTVAAVALTGGSESAAHTVARASLELFGSVGLGAAAALLLKLVLRWVHDPETSMTIALGTLLLAIGIAFSSGMDVILATLAMGFVLVNLARRRAESLFSTVRSFATPIYVLFFVLAGARLGFARMPYWLWVIVALYVLSCTAGKMTGAYWGARLTSAPRTVRRYLGLGLWPQAGVAVGLSIMASHRLGNVPLHGDLPLDEAIVFTVAATTMILQLAGPGLTKLAVRLAGEIGRDVTEEDIIASWTVREVMNEKAVTIGEWEQIQSVFQILSEHRQPVYPVVTRQGNVVGTLSLEGLRDVLASRESWEWLIVADAMQPMEQAVTPAMPLSEAMEQMRASRLSHMLVVGQDDPSRPVAILDRREVENAVANERLRRRQAAPETQPTAAPAG